MKKIIIIVYRFRSNIIYKYAIWIICPVQSPLSLKFSGYIRIVLKMIFHRKKLEESI